MNIQSVQCIPPTHDCTQQAVEHGVLTVPYQVGGATGALGPGANFYESTFSETKIRFFFPRFKNILQKCNEN